jgi:16S rRNA (cytosine967-C5)-methyltransferase
MDLRRRPASEALKDWGSTHRYAGSGDRAAIAALVFDVLRRKLSAGWIMDNDTPRGILIGTLLRTRALSAEEIAALFTGDRFAPSPLTASELAALAPDMAERRLALAPRHVLADIPEWIETQLAGTFGDDLVAEAQALAERAPIDVRVNALKALRADVLPELAAFGAAPTPLAPSGLRIPARADGKAPAIQSDPTFLKGLIEIQDEGSQLVSLCATAREGDEVLDLCAGGGGKSLALAAQMNNRGQVYATDNDSRRLAPIHARLERAGARNVQVRTPKGRGAPPIDDLAGRMDVVLVDAPCTGVGTWRRNPDAKWRVRPGSLAQRIGEQDQVLKEGARFVRSGGRLVYITCSVLPAENSERIAAFLDAEADFAAVAPAQIAEQAGIPALARHADPSGLGLLLTPYRTGCDGFFCAVLERRSGA